jgi:hypothetical protein
MFIALAAPRRLSFVKERETRSLTKEVYSGEWRVYKHPVPTARRPSQLRICSSIPQRGQANTWRDASVQPASASEGLVC